MGGLCGGLGWGAWGGLGVVGLILNLVFYVGLLAVLGLGTTWLVRQLSRQPVAAKAGTDPLEIARRRLAAGDITVGEFEEIRSRLR
jgi:uncharacterized membrane protein